MTAHQSTRREFLALSSGLIAGLTVGLAPLAKAHAAPYAYSTVIYRLSVRGRRAPKAVKKHAANKRFRTEEAARHQQRQAGHTCRVVPLTVSQKEFDRLFARQEYGYQTMLDVVDLRQI